MDGEPRVYGPRQEIFDSTIFGDVFQVVAESVQLFVDPTQGPSIGPMRPYPQPLPEATATDVPALLLEPEFAVAPFWGRQAEAARLNAWLTSRSLAGSMLIHGAAGVGKTRLGYEFAESARLSGWNVWSPVAGQAVWSSSEPYSEMGHLLVVDNADDYSAQWIEYNLRMIMRGGLKVRLLLLARPSGSWWLDHANAFRKLGINSQSLEIQGLSNSADVQEIFAQSINAYTNFKFLGPPALSGYSFTNSPVSMMDINMAALVSCMPSSHLSTVVNVGVPPSVALLHRERDRWDRLRRGGRIETSLEGMAQVAWLSSLIGPLNYRDAASAIMAVMKCGRRDSDQMLKDYSVAFPSVIQDEQLQPMAPKTLAEDFLALQTPGHGQTYWAPDPWVPAAFEDLIAWRPEHQEYVDGRPLSVILRAYARWAHLEGFVVTGLSADPRIALAAGSAALVALAKAQSIPDSTLESILSVAPTDRSLDLDAGLAALEVRLLATRLDRCETPVARAQFYIAAAIRTHRAGQIDDGASLAKAALQELEVLTDDSEEILALSAKCHLRLSSINYEMGGYEAAAAEALLALAVLGSSTDSRDVRSRAEVYALLACAHLEMSEDVAVDYAQKSVHLALEVLQDDPTDEVSEADYARALANLAAASAQAGQYAEALRIGEKALAALRATVKGQPGLAPGLTVCLLNYATTMASLGKRNKSRAFLEEAVNLSRELAARLPTLYEPLLANCLAALSVTRHAEGASDAPHRLNAEAEFLLRRNQSEDNQRHAISLARLLTNSRLLLAENTRDAPTDNSEALSIMKGVEARTGHFYHFEMASMLLVQAQSLMSDSDWTAAKVALTAAAVRIGLLKSHPSNWRVLRLNGIVSVTRGVAICSDETDDSVDGVEYAEEGVEILERLAETFPDVSLELLPSVYHNLAFCYSAANQHGEAVRTQRLAVDRQRGAPRTEPDHAAHLARALQSLALYCAEAGIVDEKLKSQSEAVQIFESLALHCPEAFADAYNESAEILRLFEAAGEKYQRVFKVSFTLGHYVAFLVIQSRVRIAGGASWSNRLRLRGLTRFVRMLSREDRDRNGTDLLGALLDNPRDLNECNRFVVWINERAEDNSRTAIALQNYVLESQRLGVDVGPVFHYQMGSPKYLQT